MQNSIGMSTCSSKDQMSVKSNVYEDCSYVGT